MKKLFSLLVCLICAAMLATTCFAAAAPDAYATYKKAVKDMDAAQSLEMSGTVKMTLEMDGAEIGTTTQKSTVAMLYAGDKVQMKMTVKESETGTAIEQYYKDGYMYQKAADKKTKYKLDVEDAVSSTGTIDGGLSKDVFKDATVEQTADGTRIKFKVKFDDLANNNGTAIMDEVAKSVPGAKIRVGNVSYSMLIGPDNKLKSYAMAFIMNMDYEGATIKNKVNVSYKVVSIDKVTKIDFPADLNTYKPA